MKVFNTQKRFPLAHQDSKAKIPSGFAILKATAEPFLRAAVIERLQSLFSSVKSNSAP